jgi:hypothetical protein
MSASTRWVVAVLAAVAIISLLIWARGDDHHHGDEIGSLGASETLTGP